MDFTEVLPKRSFRIPFFEAKLLNVDSGPTAMRRELLTFQQGLLASMALSTSLLVDSTQGSRFSITCESLRYVLRAVHVDHP